MWRLRTRLARTAHSAVVGGCVLTGAVSAAEARDAAAPGDPSELAQLTLRGPSIEPGPTPRALEPPSGVTRIADLGFGDAKAAGQRAVQDFFFPGSGDYAVGEASALTLELAHSNLLVPARSTVSITFNGRSLRALRLDASNVEPARYMLAIPRELVRKDFNQLRLEYAITLGQVCEDPAHPALFATLLGQSQLRIDGVGSAARLAQEPPNLAAYPYPFFRTGYPRAAVVALVVPDAPNAVELTAAYRLAADLASRVEFPAGALELHTTGSLTRQTLAERQLIVIGTAARQPLAAELLAAGGAREAGALAADDAVLALVASPWNAALRALLVSGASDAALGCAVDALTTPEPAALLAGATAVLTEPIPPAAANREPARAFTFRQLGQPDRTVQGTLPDTTTLTFVAPALAADAYAELELVVTTPETIDAHSNVGVDLNGMLVQTLALQRDGVRARHRVRLPAAQLLPGPNSLRLRTTLYPDLAGDDDCAFDATERVWAVLHDDSALALPADRDVRPGGGSLATLPFPFAGSGGLRDTTLVVDPAQAASLRAGLDVAVALGRASSGPSALDTLPLGEATPERLGKRHLLLAGIDPASALARAVERALPVVLHGDGTRELVQSDQRLAEVLSATRIGVAQVDPVPWAPGFALLSVSGSDDEALAWASGGLARRLEGTVAVFRGADAVTGFTIERLSSSDQTVEDRFTRRESLLRQLAAFALVAAGAVTLLVLWTQRARLPLRG
ncbi:MAG: hypothetical protein EXR63_05345 [Dehalococcoidia bacterium]|nr:hypothetical protein [Dehalococcoidia bacterium]